MTQDTKVFLKQHLKSLAEIGVALTSEKNIGRILEMIINEAMGFARADGGTIYLYDSNRNVLRFGIVRNRSLGTSLGGRAEPIQWAPVPLENKDGSPNTSNVSAYVAITKEVVNISDVYETEQFDFGGTRKYDEKSGYRSKSMLVVPMLDHEGGVAGVLQLINATMKAGKTLVSFDAEQQELVESLASQAAVALNNAQLIRGLEELFDSLITSIGMAIDEKSSYTGGHVRRVALLAAEIGRAINRTSDGPLAEHELDKDDLKELTIAGWLHDLGKVTTPESLLNKGKKLVTLTDRAELIRLRYEVEKLRSELRWMGELANRDNADPSAKESLQKKLRDLDEECDFVLRWNEPTEAPDTQMISRLEMIKNERGTLNDDELENLCIRRGTLTQGERKQIENHAAVTSKMLDELKFPRSLAGVPTFAGSHHEMLDGSGYPEGLSGDNVPLQARILAVADIFEALTARRPYKDAISVKKSLSILNGMAEEGKLDANIIKAAIEQGVFKNYAKKELKTGD